MAASLIRATRSLCPVCLREVPARLLADGDDVILEGRCDEHGPWQTSIWSGPPSFESWCGPDASLAARQTCTVVMEVTRRCDLGCPVCFAEASRSVAEPDPPRAELAGRFSRLFAAEGAINLQLSGGEPTMRPDLPEVVADASAAGFAFVQLNTNGLRLAAEDGYAERLRDAGLESVFLQFDGLTEETYRSLRGRALLADKLRAVERCAEAGLAVVLVPTVVPGVNDQEIGPLVRFAAAWAGVVRGLHLQPVRYCGRYPRNGRPRLTLPQVLRALEQQTAGQVHAADFAPSCCEHPRCSFRARYWVREGGRLEPVRAKSCCCAPEPVPAPAPDDAPRRAVAATSRSWGRKRPEAGTCDASESGDDLSRFLADAERILTISGMLFQDAWSIDMERIGRCCVRVATSGGDLESFCLWNLTGASGERLLPRG